MRSLIQLSDYSREEIFKIFEIADKLQQGEYRDFLKGKTVIMFFPDSSIRTRVTFEKGIFLLGGQTILFSSETLDKKEEIRDVIGYLNNWADAVVVRHKNIDLLERIQQYSNVPVINAMTDVNHPCEMLADLYSLSKIRKNFLKDQYLFCGGKCNIGLAWKEIADVVGLSFSQCCPRGYEMENVDAFNNIYDAVKGKDIICTDSLPKELLPEFSEYQITMDIMALANDGAILNPCPPFYREEEVAGDVLNSSYFVGYEFKKYLMEIQQAILIFNMMN